MSGPAIPSRGAGFAMPASSFLEQTLSIDLDAQMAQLEGKALVDELKAKRAQVVAIARELAEPDLLPLLEWVLDITLRRPVFLPNLGSQALSYCAMREGQNQIAWQILQAIAEGREERLQHREGM